MIVDQYKIEEQKRKGGRVKQPPFYYLHAFRHGKPSQVNH